ncbi:FMN-binding protein [Streptomyces sp. NPDC018693]|uniref:FMN-binding protein n=1 Tax=unclassified Streptomyces TaxID=2593676 RepID=UPI00378C90B1
MKRAIPVLVLSIAGLIPVWRYEPSLGTTVTEAAEPASTPSVSSSAGSDSTVVTGTTVQTEKGPVQVQVTFQGEKITAVKLLQQPNHPQTTAAVPKLIEATLEAQSADVDAVSGATITSEGYRDSLQAAIDANAQNTATAESTESTESTENTENTASAPADTTSEVVAGSTVTSEGDKESLQVAIDAKGA